MAVDHEPAGWPDLFVLIWGDPVGRWVIYALLVVVFGIGVWRGIVKIRALLEEFREDIKVTRNQVANDHTTNLRVEQDERHRDNTLYLTRIDGKIDTILGILGAHDSRLGRLEDTVDRPVDRST